MLKITTTVESMNDFGGMNIFQEPLKIYCKFLTRKTDTIGSSFVSRVCHIPVTLDSESDHKSFSSQIASWLQIKILFSHHRLASV